LDCERDDEIVVFVRVGDVGVGGCCGDSIGEFDVVMDAVDSVVDYGAVGIGGDEGGSAQIS
jgi:hypothetical protein